MGFEVASVAIILQRFTKLAPKGNICWERSIVSLNNSCVAPTFYIYSIVVGNSQKELKARSYDFAFWHSL